jgi:hypothetical protein
MYGLSKTPATSHGLCKCAALRHQKSCHAEPNWHEMKLIYLADRLRELTDACEDAISDLHIGVHNRTLWTEHVEDAVHRIYCRRSKRSRRARGDSKLSCFFYEAGLLPLSAQPCRDLLLVHVSWEIA